MPDDRCSVLKPTAPARLKELPQNARRLGGVYSRSQGWADAANESDLADHLQGIAVCSQGSDQSDRFFVTTSARGGLVLSGVVATDGGRTEEYRVDCQSAVGSNHPGGIQTIGQYAIVPVYDTKHESKRSVIQAWYESSGQNGVQLEKKVIHTLPAGAKAYCAGICYREDFGYLLALGLQSRGRLIGLYRKNNDGNEDGLLDGGKFIHFASVKTRKPHPNNISLCVDQDGTVSLLGFRLSGKFKSIGFGNDKVDLYTLSGSLLNKKTHAPQSRTRITRDEVHHLRCRPGGEQPSFRWGASARVSKNGKMEIVACGYQIFRANGHAAFEVDRFRA